ncbi:type IX secretion system protein PorQ [Parabacteroides sp. OttesenSCG-928-G21]|nr:type IX secretion system protein PorQ [Parabacteroides sp. OttesenSCG-928-G21]
MMKRNIWCLLFLMLPLIVSAQNGEEVFGFLRYPASARANALGGNTVALIERDPSLTFHNPGLLGGEMDGMINLNYLNYISDINWGSVLYSRAHKERGAWAIGVSYINYGDIRETLLEGTIVGNTSANDITIGATYAYDLSDNWRGGITLKFLYSSFADFTSTGLCADIGLSYYDPDKNFSAGFVLKNMGAQLSPYEDDRQRLPWDIQVGITKKMNHAPIRFSLTAMYLDRWEFNYIDNTSEEVSSDTFFETFAKHLIIGVDFIPSENFWIGVGFNPKKNMDMKLQNGNKLGGFSAGAGVKIRMFDVGVSVARYHPSATSLMLSVSATLADFK